MQDNIPIYFIGIGAQKAATSWLHRCLCEHPEICLPAEKETHFFSGSFEKGWEWYFSRFAHCDTKSYKGEISTSYLSHPEAPERIAENLSRVRILVSLRNPFERTVSHINHLLSNGLIDKKMTTSDVIERFPEVIENSRYATNLKRYYSYIPREHIHIIWYEDIVSDPIHIYSQIANFLEIDSTFRPASLEERFNTGNVRMSPFFNMINRLYFLARKYKLGRMIIRIIRSIGIRTHRFEAWIAKRGSKKEQDHEWKFPQETIELFNTEVTELEYLVNTDLSFWKRKYE